MSKGYITNGITLDGFGARMHRVIQTMIVSLYLRDKYNVDIEYIHTPLNYEGFDIDFNMNEENRTKAGGKYPYNENDRDGYMKRAILWNNKMGYNGKTINDINLNDFQIINDRNRLWSDLSLKTTDNKIYILETLHREFNGDVFDINLMDRYYDNIRDKFNLQKVETKVVKKQTVKWWEYVMLYGFYKAFKIALNLDKYKSVTIPESIVIHIRRRDAINEAVRYLDDEYYLSILKNLTPFRDKYNITIHTQRQGFQAHKYDGWKIIYDDEEEDFDFFVKMVNAKILVIGKSSLSYCAGLLNQNIVVYPPQNTKGLNRWIDKEKLIKLL